MTAPAPTPQLSAVLYATDSLDTVRKTLRHLQAQTAREQVELVIVATPAVRQEITPAIWRDFASGQVVEVPGDMPAHKAVAAGVRAAQAPVVAMTENHCFPEPDWAAALVAAHRGPCVAVGPVMENANPGTLMSWACQFINYGQWTGPHSGGVVRDLPGHNSSYKRAVLLAYGATLEEMLERQSVLHVDLQTKGYEFVLEPAARVNHLNVSRWWSAIADQYYNGRSFAGARAGTGHWGIGNRLRAALATPLIITGWLRAILRDLRRCGHWDKLWPRILPALLVGLSARGFGEVTGYLGGIGNSTASLTDFELYRNDHLCSRDRLTEETA